MNSIDSLLNTYPSLKRVPDKDRVRRFSFIYIYQIKIFLLD
jgi:hypothetical protein